MCFVKYTKITYTHRSTLELVLDWAGPYSLLSSEPITHYLKRQKQVQSKLVMPSNHLVLCCTPSPAFNLSPHQGLFQQVGSLDLVAKYQSFSISPSNDIQGCFPLGLTDLILQSEGLSRVFSITIQNRQFFRTHFKAQFQFFMSSRAWVDKCFL